MRTMARRSGREAAWRGGSSRARAPARGAPLPDVDRLSVTRSVSPPLHAGPGAYTHACTHGVDRDTLRSQNISFFLLSLAPSVSHVGTSRVTILQIGRRACVPALRCVTLRYVTLRYLTACIAPLRRAPYICHVCHAAQACRPAAAAAAAAANPSARARTCVRHDTTSTTVKVVAHNSLASPSCHRT